MKFFKFSDYIRSWSVWVLGAFAITPVFDHFTGIVTELVPAEYKPLAVLALGTLGLIVRAIKQGGK